MTFDRYLNPLSVNRQGVTIVDEFGNVPTTPIVQYDPVTRVVTLLNPTPGAKWLEVGQFYKLVFPVSQPDADTLGLRAIDGATIDPETPPIGFAVIAPLSPPLPPGEPTIDFCADVYPLFQAHTFSATQGACANANCHGVAGQEPLLVPAMGLDLQSEEGIRHTAIGVAASETSGAQTTPLSTQPSFAVGMPIIAPNDPGDSYLLYKLLLPDENGVPSARGTSVPYTACKPVTPPWDYGPSADFASQDEAARLAAKIPGRRMPWGDFDPSTTSFGVHGGTPLTLDEIERIRLWIQQGAEVDDCVARACQATCDEPYATQTPCRKQP